jgi:hypothetical protein
MTRHLTHCFTLAILVLPPRPMLADSSIKTDAGNPKGGAATVESAGTFQVDKGATFKSITLYVVNPCGGEGWELSCTITGNQWKGKITGVPAGTYSAFAILHVTVDGESESYNTPILNVVVN